jgi:hypothetical protein
MDGVGEICEEPARGKELVSLLNIRFPLCKEPTHIPLPISSSKKTTPQVTPHRHFLWGWMSCRCLSEADGKLPHMRFVCNISSWPINVRPEIRLGKMLEFEYIGCDQ